jgi:ABC-type dipeptide/oligopeptide/nickel transport system permease component
MAGFIVRRLMAALTALVLLSLATFVLLRVMPGDDVVCDGFCSIAHRNALRHEYGLDKPLFPVSVEMELGALWLLGIPAAGIGGYTVGRSRRDRARVPS